MRDFRRWWRIIDRVRNVPIAANPYDLLPEISWGISVGCIMPEYTTMQVLDQLDLKDLTALYESRWYKPLQSQRVSRTCRTVCPA